MSDNWANIRDVAAAWGALIATLLMFKELYVFARRGPKLTVSVQVREKKFEKDHSINILIGNTGDQPCSLLAIKILHVRSNFFRRASVIGDAIFDSTVPISPVRTLAPGDILKFPVRVFDGFAKSEDQSEALDVFAFHDRSARPTKTRWRKSNLA
jgi:hypothetical protein